MLSITDYHRTGARMPYNTSMTRNRKSAANIQYLIRHEDFEAISYAEV